MPSPTGYWSFLPTEIAGAQAHYPELTLYFMVKTAIPTRRRQYIGVSLECSKHSSAPSLGLPNNISLPNQSGLKHSSSSNPRLRAEHRGSSRATPLPCRGSQQQTMLQSNLHIRIQLHKNSRFVRIKFRPRLEFVW